MECRDSEVPLEEEISKKRERDREKRERKKKSEERPVLSEWARRERRETWTTLCFPRFTQRRNADSDNFG